MSIRQKKQVKIDPAMLDGIDVPILILDRAWLAHVKKADNEAILALQAIVKDYMKEIGGVNDRLERLIKRKRELLTRILSLTEESFEKNNPEAKQEMAKLNADVGLINTEMERLERRAEQLPPLLDKANKRLLFETVSVYYVRMREKRERLAELNPEIDRLRARLKALNEEKLAAEDDVDKTYSLLHSLIGSDLLETLDVLYGRE